MMLGFAQNVVKVVIKGLFAISARNPAADLYVGRFYGY